MEDATGNGKETGAEKVRWDLSQLYAGPDDPRIDADLERFEQLAQLFRETYRGKLSTQLGAALAALIELNTIGDKPQVYLMLAHAADTRDEAIKTKMMQVRERSSFVFGQHLTFFELELAQLPQKDVDRQAETDEVVRKHLPHIKKAQLFRDHQLSEPVEEALAKRGPFGAGSWSTFYSQIKSDLKVELPDGEVSLVEALHVLTEGETPEIRAEALRAVDQALDGTFIKLATETLNNVVRSKALEDSERKYPHSMAQRNMENMLDDAVVDALHQATAEVAAPLMRQHYQLKAAHLGLDKLAWSDRNANLPFADTTVIPFDEARGIVTDAFQSFSPTLAELVQNMLEQGRVDAPAAEGKRGGAFNMSWCLPGEVPTSYVFLNYQGSTRDVLTMAHESGHAAHGLLAGEAQGTLMMHAPMAYAETASIFGEMITFQFLTDRLQQQGDEQAMLNLLHSKADDFANSVVRQIGFSQFEQRVHGAGQRLSVDEMNQAWLESTYPLYGQPGDIFTFDNSSRLWCYVPHFHRPFYVYAYATGELFTQSLFAVRDRFGDEFEQMLLDMMRAGSTKDGIELLKPFDLNPADPDFWKRGIEISFGAWIQEAIRLSAKMGIKIE